ncbi:SDR family oxidoreductase [Saccharopolyspora sp. K220]|uniref:SDR family NAD(P)-dependent oxidoreductase n=1 Tax=Saccharopolyspora soli TaxID=2926618 RepID=UPI001F565312|nr:SDR family oxidoreductase [Saccharopolyspora soli]MCI2415937.1 SDR family oxidoreductase [Saccharopolyspora soli]
MHGKAGLVTGAASGIGRACAIRLAAEGAAVVVADLESAREGGAETVRTIEDAGGRAEFFACDVASEQDNEALVAHVVERFGSLDFAHNNAGIGVHKLLADTEAAEFDRVIAVNLRGTFLGMKYQIQQMLRGGGGSIVNTSSNAGLRGVRLLSAYTASKHGIVGLTKNGAIEYAEEGIRVNAVCPGAIMTPLMSGISPQRQEEILRPQAMRRPGDPAEVAAAVAWLCSDDSSFVTGIAMPVDAGSVAGW